MGGGVSRPSVTARNRAADLIEPEQQNIMFASLESAADIIKQLNMQPHPEGGHYVETYRAPCASGERAAMTAIYYLLEVGDLSHWHRIDATETWLWHSGAPLAITVSPDGNSAASTHLGPDIGLGQAPQLVIPPMHWQTAESLGAWTLVSCVVAPGFSFDGFELAPTDWRPKLRAATHAGTGSLQ